MIKTVIMFYSTVILGLVIIGALISEEKLKSKFLGLLLIAPIIAYFISDLLVFFS